MANIEINEYQDYILPLYFEKGYEASNIKELLLMFYNDGTDLGGSASTTYYDPECTNTQCDSGKIRSFENVLSIVLTYFPETSFEDFVTTLIQLDIKNTKLKSDKKLVFFPAACSDIERITIYWHSIYEKRSYKSLVWNVPDGREESLYSWEEILENIGINDIEDLEKKVYENRRK